MRLEGWHVMVFLAMLVMAAVVVLGVTLVVLWTVRGIRRKNNGDGSGPPYFSVSALFTASQTMPGSLMRDSRRIAS